MSFSLCLLSQQTPPSTFLHSSPGLSIIHPSFFVAFICTLFLNTGNAARGTHSLEVTVQRATAGTSSLPTFHAAAFHSAKPFFLSLCPFPTFPSSCLRAGLKSWKKAVSVPSQRSPGRSPLSSGLLLPNAGGSPLEKNQQCPRCIPSLEQIYPVGPPSPSTGIISWVSAPLRLTRCSWLCSLGVLALLLSFSPHPEPSSVSLQSPSPLHPCA